MAPYYPHTDQDRDKMLHFIGLSSLEALFESIPNDVKIKKDLQLPGPLSEIELLETIRTLAEKNVSGVPCFLGAGAYQHYIPAVVSQLISRSEFYTAYTPYQAEVSQGILQAVFEYQTLICQLTGMEASNASLYDGANAAVEAVSMALNITGKRKVLISQMIHPEITQVLQSYLKTLNIQWDIIAESEGSVDLEQLQKVMDSDSACFIFQTPNFFGIIEEACEVEKIVHQHGALLISIVDPISLGILQPPSEYNADIAVGEGQALGNPISFGGPYLGFIATKQQYLRKLPGRIVGETVDANGKRGFVLTLQAREQHIRREKALSNICSNQALNALAASIYLTTMGKQGLQEVAELCLQKAHYAAEQMNTLPHMKLAYNKPFFKEFAVRSSINPIEIQKKLLKNNILGGYPLGKFYPQYQDCTLYCITEKNSKAQIDHLVQCLEVL